jgi:predicted aspartyl protease
MGLTQVTVSISNLNKSGGIYEALFLVDTGSINCLAGRNELEKIGIKPEGKSVYELANGEPVEYEHGFARVTFMGTETVTPIIFGPDNVEPILGVLALEAGGIMVDPVTNTLKKMAAIPLK